MNRKLLKKAAALVLSGIMILGSAKFMPQQPMSSEAAGAKSRVSVHDPSVVKVGSTYYVFGSHIDAARSSDLQNWERFTNGYTTPNNVEFGNLSQNLKKAFDWAGEDLGDCEGGFAVWAPDVYWDEQYINSDGTKGAYLMYFCTSSTWNTSVIAYAASKEVTGPYTFVDTLIYSGFTSNDTYAKSKTKNVNRKYTSTNIDELMGSGQVSFNNSWFADGGYNYREFPNAIDPTIYTDTDGKMYMVYGSWSGGIFTLEMDPATGKCIHPKSGTTSDGRMIDSYFGTKLSGGYHKSGEGPFIEYNPDTDYYYLWETYGGLLSDGGYNMRVFRSKFPTGPFLDPAGNSPIQTASTKLDNFGLKVMGNYKFSSLNKAYMACGHNSVLRDDDGQWYLLYHARFDDGTEYHEVRVHQMYFNADGWPVVSPFEYSGDKISFKGYNEEDIVGEYEFINHGNATDGKIITPQKIKLNADHTITGDASGKWEEDSGRAAAVFTIGIQKYSGYFMVTDNEAGKKVMTFTAVGSNNRTIWGVKNDAFTGSDRTGWADYTDHNSQLVNNKDSLSTSGGAYSAATAGSGLISGLPYYIVNLNSGLAIDLPNGKLEDGTNIQQWDFNKLWAQQWRLISVDSEWCRIVSLGDESKCIAVAQDSAADGVNVELQTYTGADNQLFKFVKSKSGSYGILSKCSGGGGALDVFEWSKENGGNINQYAYNEYECQLWNIEPVCPEVTPGNCYVLRTYYGSYIGVGEGPVRNKNAVVTTEEPVKWILSSDGNDSYYLKLPSGGEMSSYDPVLLAVGKEKLFDEEFVEYRSVSDTKDAKLKFVCNNDGTYTILTGASDFHSCLQLNEIATGQGGYVSQAEYNGKNYQKFILEPVAPDPEPVMGDVNADGELNVADIVMLQNHLLGRGDVDDAEAGDLCSDGKLTVFDLIALKRLYFNR